ncbi:unnamed protein product [Moneuplotes crassus]|uniref:Uncharacterized protein n=1 Tax=Euplotes crassus TaxID=5936 RepID=A0AAD1XKK4_EUPCR|nr:unnamed protein product [Moneuplotes crassus]
MESIPFKHKALIVIGSSILFYCFNQLVNWKKQEKLSETSDISEDTVIMVSEEMSLDEPSGVHREEESRESLSDDEFNYNLVYTNKNNCVIDCHDEIIATNNARDCESLSRDSSTISPHKARKTKGRNREQNARKFFEKLSKTKSKVVKKKLEMEDYYARLKNSKGFVKIGHQNLKEIDLSSENSSCLTEGDDGSCMNSQVKNKNRSKKDPSKDLFKSGTEKKFQSMERSSSIKKAKVLVGRKPKKIRKKDLKVHYNDLNKKDNYVFFELLATYADQYLDNKEATTMPETEKRLR